MTLRELLRNLVVDETARERFEHDPAATLQEQGFEAIDPSLLGTALVHYADSADATEFDRLQVLLDRYGPLADTDATAVVDTESEPAANLLDLDLEHDATAGIDDLAVEPDEPASTSAAEGPEAEAPPSFGSGSSESTNAVERETAPDTTIPSLDAGLAGPDRGDPDLTDADLSFVPDPPTGPTVLDDIGTEFELDVPDEPPAMPSGFDDLGD